MRSWSSPSAARDGLETELAGHIRAALCAGCTKEEILEVMLQLAVYAGFPAAVNGTFVADRIFQETREEKK